MPPSSSRSQTTTGPPPDIAGAIDLFLSLRSESLKASGKDWPPAEERRRAAEILLNLLLRRHGRWVARGGWVFEWGPEGLRHRRHASSENRMARANPGKRARRGTDPARQLLLFE